MGRCRGFGEWVVIDGARASVNDYAILGFRSLQALFGRVRG